MSQKHFVALAAVLNKFYGINMFDNVLVEAIAGQIADYCATENSLFNRKKFMAAVRRSR